MTLGEKPGTQKKAKRSEKATATWAFSKQIAEKERL